MSKKRWLLYGIFGLVFYLLFLIIEMPASWFAWGLNHYTHGTVRLDPIAGSLWNGTGRLVVYYPKNTPHDLGHAEWSIKPLWLLIGRFQVSLETNNQDRQIKTTIGIARNSFTLKDTDVTLPASFIAQIYTPISLISPQGKVRITAAELNVSSEKMEGTAALEWLNAVSSLSSVQPLGDYRLDIAGAEKNVNLKITTLRGDLGLSGQGQWQLSDGQITFTGEAVAARREKELEPLMQLLGKETGPGRRSIAYTQTLFR